MAPMSPGTGTGDGVDLDALLRAAVDDPEAFGAFYGAAVDRILAYCYGRTYCPEVAADLTAETFAAALVGLRRYDPVRGRASQWLFGIARNLVRQWARYGRVEASARRRLRIVTPVWDDGTLARIETLVDLTRTREAMAQALASLNRTERLVVELRVVEEHDYDVIADRLGCTVASARARTSEALAKLRRRLDGRAGLSVAP